MNNNKFTLKINSVGKSFLMLYYFGMVFFALAGFSVFVLPSNASVGMTIIIGACCFMGALLFVYLCFLEVKATITLIEIDDKGIRVNSGMGLLKNSYDFPFKSAFKFKVEPPVSWLGSDFYIYLDDKEYKFRIAGAESTPDNIRQTVDAPEEFNGVTPWCLVVENQINYFQNDTKTS